MGLAVDDDGEDSSSPPPQSPPPTALPIPYWGAGRLPQTRKRQFDVASLLAPDDVPIKRQRWDSSCEEEPEEDIDVVASDQEEVSIKEEMSIKEEGHSPLAPAVQYPLLGGWWPALDPALLQQLRRHSAPSGPPSPTDQHRPPDT